MMIYLLRKDVHFRCFIGSPRDEYYSFTGRSLASSWHGQELKMIKYFDNAMEELDPSNPLQIGELYMLNSTVPVLSERAKNFLMPSLQEYGEFLPAQYGEETFYIFNVLNISDAFDEDKSEYLRYSTGRISTVYKYAFNKEKLMKAGHIFKLQHERVGILVTDDFVRIVEKSNLKGWEFTPLKMITTQ